MAVGQAPSCTQLTFPADGDVDVSLSPDLEWDASPTATGYVILAGTSIGGHDILDNVDVDNVTEYSFDTDLPPLQNIHVAIIPYNDQGLNGSCAEVVFTTMSVDGLPGCADFTSPGHAAQDVPLTPNLSWDSAIDATGYFLTIGTSTGNNIILDSEDVGNITNFTSPTLLENTTYYVAIVPYNDVGAATGCGVQSSFTTRGAPEDMNKCTSLINPANGATNVPASTGISWVSEMDAQGYFLTVGTTANSDDILRNLDVGNTTSYQFSTNLPKGATIYVTIHPYTDLGRAQDCSEESFTVEQLIPTSDNLGVPTFFTPNNDGYNDTWIVNSSQDFSIQNISVFNRFGKLIKQLAPDQGWDGTFNGRNLPSDSYWYSVELADGPSLKGYFALKR
ncbi:T9SS type B sorting domain-containing protein [Ulvibacterium sp.]|uniref:T9SS type B sorting domain-containing protein n=1 Tax=Ulvibacterium sp. TaxID=2665914 RepID=UPI003BA8B8A8